MTNYDTIQELRAELTSILDADERRQIRRELDAAIRRQAQIDAQLDDFVPPE